MSIFVYFNLIFFFRNHQPDDKLPEVVAELAMLTVTNGMASSPNTTKRVLRKRVPKPNPEILNRR